MSVSLNTNVSTIFWTERHKLGPKPSALYMIMHICLCLQTFKMWHNRLWKIISVYNPLHFVCHARTSLRCKNNPQLQRVNNWYFDFFWRTLWPVQSEKMTIIWMRTILRRFSSTSFILGPSPTGLRLLLIMSFCVWNMTTLPTCGSQQ